MEIESLLTRLEARTSSTSAKTDDVPVKPACLLASTSRTSRTSQKHLTGTKCENPAIQDEKLHELDLLIEYVAANNGFSDEDIIEAKNNAENDVENALLSFRALARAVRRVKVLELLEQNPDIQRAIYTDATSNEHYVTLAIAIWGYATCEVRISKASYDPSQLLDLIEKYGHQTH